MVDSRALSLALATAFQRAGGKLVTNEAVVRIERNGGRAAIAHTPFGLYHADVFVLAAGAWSGLIESELAPIAPVKGEMIALEPPPNVLGGRWCCPEQVIWGHGIYLVPRDGRLLVGATAHNALASIPASPMKPRAFSAGGAGARKAVMPGLEGLGRWWDQWAGLRPSLPPLACRCWGPPAWTGFGWPAGNFATASCSLPPLPKA